MFAWECFWRLLRRWARWWERELRLYLHVSVIAIIFGAGSDLFGLCIAEARGACNRELGAGSAWLLDCAWTAVIRWMVDSRVITCGEYQAVLC